MTENMKMHKTDMMESGCGEIGATEDERKVKGAGRAGRWCVEKRRILEW